jgi:hypothetical protein
VFEVVVAAGPLEAGEFEADAETPGRGFQARRPSGMTSLPMPSPAMTAILWVFMAASFSVDRSRTA